MRHNFLDRYSRTSGPIQRLPASAKLATAFALILALVTVPAGLTAFFAAAATTLAITAAFSRIPARFLLLRLLFFLPFVLGIAGLNLLRPGGEAVFVIVVVRSVLCIFTIILLSNTTPFSEIIGVLGRLGLPKLLLTILALMYRYLFVLIDEAERMQRARLSRSGVQSRFRTWRSLGVLIGQLFVRSTERAERIYAAMMARGWE